MNSLLQTARALAAVEGAAQSPLAGRSFVPPARPDRSGDIVVLLRRTVAASLAGGIIAASGRPHTAAEALALMREVEAALLPK